ncbi:MAG: hypothetical protein J0H15_02460 [Xanthomonadales bacterium]|nr:hypothetical protein [Xanthomonadales bacterium]
MFQTMFQLPRPRHPLARFALAVVGAGLLLLMAMFGMILFAAVALGGALWLLVARLRGSLPRRPRAGRVDRPAGIIEGEFRVLRDHDGPA